MRGLLAKIASRFSPSAKRAALKAAMKADWDRRGRENAMHYVADFEETWSGREEEFFVTGKDDVEKCLKQLEIEIQPGQKLQVLTYNGSIHLIPVVPIEQLRGFLKGIDTDVPREREDRV